MSNTQPLNLFRYHALAICICVGVSACKGSTSEDVDTKSSLPVVDTEPKAETNADIAESAALCIDPDGDGWGWNGVATCKTEPSSDSLDTDIVQTTDTYNGSSIPQNCQKLESGNFHITELVTDVFLTAGQSNATGSQTLLEPDNYSEDVVNSRVIVWTEDNQWEVANPMEQTWHNGRYPSGRHDIGNHPGFQIGRAIAELDECRVVAFIATAASGMPIDHWLENRDNHYQEINTTVAEAINALPTKHDVDMIWWMQGEADNDSIISRYFGKLTTLISTFRNETWFPFDSYFLANETGWHLYANEAIRMLTSDADPFSDFSNGEDTPTDPFPHLTFETQPTHFNEVALRKIGYIVAHKYVNEYLPTIE